MTCVGYMGSVVLTYQRRAVSRRSGKFRYEANERKDLVVAESRNRRMKVAGLVRVFSDGRNRLNTCLRACAGQVGNAAGRLGLNG